MPLNIKNREVEQLAREVAEIAGESKTEAIRRALEERRQRLTFRIAHRDRRGQLMRLLENEIWPAVPPEERGRRLTRDEEDAILGYGKHGA